MSPDNNPASRPEEPGNRHFEIFVGTIKEEWTEHSVLASDIMTKAGVSPPDNFVLEALDRPNGRALKEFRPSDAVDLREKDRKFFRATPGGGGFS